MEFVREIQTNFNRWCTASGVKTLSYLRELVVLEQFKNSVPPRIATYVGEAKVHTADILFHIWLLNYGIAFLKTFGVQTHSLCLNLD